MLRLRARDGAAFVMEMGDVKAAVEGAGADGPDRRRALTFRMAMQADIGMPEDRVRLLTRAEAGALASEVQSAAPQDKAAKVAGLQDLYGPLFGRAMKELSEEGLDPRFRVLAGARRNPALARILAEAIEAGGAEVEKDAAETQEIRDDVRDAAADAASTGQPGGETAEAIEAIRSAAEDLGVQFFRQTGRKDESIRRAAAFANGAIEEMHLMAADAGEGGDDSLTGNGHESPAQQGNAENGAKTAQADNAKSMPQSQGKPVDPWPASPVRPKFRDELNKRESQQNNYREEIAGVAWGRYQMTKPALKDLGMMDAKGNWTGKHGIHNSNEFLGNPKVQEKVLAEYMKRNLDQLRANGALGGMGQKISGVKAQIAVTESGLLAAAHRQGAGVVKQYLDHQRRHNWTTNLKTFPKNKKDQFLSVETRLREFQNVPVWKPRGASPLFR